MNAALAAQDYTSRVRKLAAQFGSLLPDTQEQNRRAEERAISLEKTMKRGVALGVLVKARFNDLRLALARTFTQSRRANVDTMESAARELGVSPTTMTLAKADGVSSPQAAPALPSGPVRRGSGVGRG